MRNGTRKGALAVLFVAASFLGPHTAPAAAGEETLETFVPSEKLPADSAVAFPADI